jgi:hypothetical protein
LLYFLSAPNRSLEPSRPDSYAVAPAPRMATPLARVPLLQAPRRTCPASQIPRRRHLRPSVSSFSAAAVPGGVSGPVLRTCKNCKKQYDPAANHPSSCRHHTAHFGGEKSSLLQLPAHLQTVLSIYNHDRQATQ